MRLCHWPVLLPIAESLASLGDRGKYSTAAAYGLDKRIVQTGPKSARFTSMATLSLRRLWVIYKRTALKEGLSPRERIKTQLAFYSGARGVLRVLAYSWNTVNYEELHATNTRQPSDWIESEYTK